MTATVNTGGAAFPDPGRAQSAKQREALTETGMTLRDYFAGQAVAGLLAQRLPAHQGEDGAETVAQDAYIVADAMLAERAK